MTSQDLANRYGAPARGGRLVRYAVTGVVAAVALVWLAWATLSHAKPPVDSEMVSFDVTGQHTATALVEVRLSDDATDVECLLRAFAEDHTVVGERSFSPVPEDGRRLEQTVRTERLATSVELVGCTAEGQPRPR
ncbi:DUF4307 domain-containing protein [Nocardioides dongkuii]|uniref:DUF4307 domain-containing protein n=1 Tax=Nocardioides dongkuii TaxID=2760089 RepID=UPI0015FAFFE7|nr:DUF4307 domain-containing protein [Nocardioides dongkuii]